MNLLVAVESALYVIVMKFHSTGGDSTGANSTSADSTDGDSTAANSTGVGSTGALLSQKLAPAEKISQTCLPRLPLFASLVKMAL